MSKIKILNELDKVDGEYAAVHAKYKDIMAIAMRQAFFEGYDSICDSKEDAWKSSTSYYYYVNLLEDDNDSEEKT